MKLAQPMIGALALTAGAARGEERLLLTGAEARGTQTGAKVQAELERALSSAWRFGAFQGDDYDGAYGGVEFGSGF